MNNPILYLTQSACSQGAAPEYYRQTLSVKISFPKGEKHVHDLSIRIYNNQFRLMGCDTVTVASDSTIRQCHLEVHSPYVWHQGSYHFYLYRNGQVGWYKEIFLLAKESGIVPEKMYDISHMARELFFAQKVCNSQWWQHLVNLDYSRSALKELLHKFHFFEMARGGGNWKSFPAMFVTGSDPKELETFATQVLAGFIANDEAKRCLHLSLKEVTKKQTSWHTLLKKIKESRVTSVMIDTEGFNQRAEKLIKRLLNLAYMHQLEEIPIIFYGDPHNMMLMELGNAEMTWISETDNVFELDDIMKQDLSEDATDTKEKDETNECNHGALPKGNNHDENQMKEDEDSTGSDDAGNNTTSDKTDLESDDFDQLLDDFIHEQFGTGENEIETQEGDITPNRRFRKSLTKGNPEETLKRMIGLNRVKDEIAEAQTMALFTKERQKLGLEVEYENRNHMLFYGNPGTGKTTVAKLIGKMYHEMGLLSSGHLVETNRSNLVGEYIGQTEQRTTSAIKEARGGLLFIDEAYTLLTSEGDSKDFGKEVINTLLTVLSEPNPDMIVILAGYKDKLERLLQYNPGLKDRFPLQFHFEDYNDEELLQMARDLCVKRNYTLTQAADQRLHQLIAQAVTHRDAYFSNGRWIHNLIEHGLIKCMAQRVMKTDIQARTPVLFSRIEECDVENTALSYQRQRTPINPNRRIGFRA